MIQPSIQLPRSVAYGFTLLEVLVSIVIMAIGLLGVASLQLTSFKSSYQAHLRSMANYEAATVIDLMHSNLDEVVRATASPFHGPITDNSVDCTGYATSCSTEDMAKYEMTQWLARLAEKLPSGTATIVMSKLEETIDTRNTWAFIADVTIYWDEDKTGATGTGCDPNNAADLTCLNVATRVFQEYR